ncbi:uncharacterized protein LOC26534716 isoform X2 [Drosophila yakuba]|uniref:Uncharacterized protein, isoform B n=1 Tax=Drosophila yakuba TaxID=7245 RepID=A0A0R1E261_DROYA|nr:uncharacterized protein LOC26534716 isoform X2 [Drosophila yakuba]XP_039486575.1 uncharacterized protein LOC120448574 isoform X2 [Drosophila santomea]KRK01319.1 uncharacterized protein Dyak_GE27535, isoform B [Drosophila yakuba]
MFEADITIWPFFHTESVVERRRYIIRVFLDFCLFVVIGFVHWILMLTLLQEWFLDLVKEHSSALLLAFVFGIFLLFLFAISKPLRKMSCVNWLITLIIVECVVISLGVLIVSSGVLYMLAGLLIVALAFVLCTLIAALMAYDLTGTGLYLYALATGTYILSIYSLVLHAVLDVIWGFYLFAFCIGCVVMMFLMYHVQCIMGGRRASTKLFDDKFAALLLFHEFIGLFVLTLYWRPIMQRLQLKQ